MMMTVTMMMMMMMVMMIHLLRSKCVFFILRAKRHIVVRLTPDPS